MGRTDCAIIFDNPYRTYYVGETVTGRVELTLAEPKKIRRVILRCKGEAHVSWSTTETETVNGKSETRTVYKEGDEEYFRIEYNCIGSSGGDSFELPAGNHIYPFTCVLPPTLPSSFEGEYGYIRYTVKVILDRPWKFDQEFKAPFTVIAPFDLNTISSLRAPAKVTLEKYFCCCCCRSGPMTCIVSIAKTGYVPGEPIPILVEVDNISDKTATVSFKFLKIVTYYSKAPNRDTKKCTDELLELKLGPVEAHGSKTWNQLMVIPSLPPSNLVNCHIIDLDYILFIELSVSGLHMDEDSKIPITIGTIPLSIPPPSAPQMVPDKYSSPTAPLLGWAVPSAPTFGEYTFGTATINDKEDNEHTRFSSNAPEYRPMYPFYNFEKPSNN